MKKLLEKLFGLILAVAILLGAGNISKPNPLPEDNNDIIISSENDDNGDEIKPQCDEPEQEILQ